MSYPRRSAINRARREAFAAGFLARPTPVYYSNPVLRDACDMAMAKGEAAAAEFARKLLGGICGDRLTPSETERRALIIIRCVFRGFRLDPRLPLYGLRGSVFFALHLLAREMVQIGAAEFLSVVDFRVSEALRRNWKRSVEFMFHENTRMLRSLKDAAVEGAPILKDAAEQLKRLHLPR